MKPMSDFQFREHEGRQCPLCRAEFPEIDVAMLEGPAGGQQWYDVLCDQCGKVIRVLVAARPVILGYERYDRNGRNNVRGKPQ